MRMNPEEHQQKRTLPIFQLEQKYNDRGHDGQVIPIPVATHGLIPL